MRYTPALAIITLISTARMPAQNLPFPSSDAEWITTHVSNYCIGGSNEYRLWREYLGADTMLQNTVYHRVWFQPECKHGATGTNCQGFHIPFTGGPIQIGAIREDNGKVFFRKFDLPDSTFAEFEKMLAQVPAGQDVLLYDFNWTVNDTVDITIKSGTLKRLLVKKIETLDGRKNITLQSLSGLAYQQTIIEGMGQRDGLFGLYYNPASSSDLYLPICFYHQGVKIATSEYCEYCGLVDTHDAGAILPAKIYPNPASGRVHIEADPAAAPYLLRVFDGQGRLLHTDKAFPGNGMLSTNTLDAGGWLSVILLDQRGRIWTGRILVER